MGAFWKIFCPPDDNLIGGKKRLVKWKGETQGLEGQVVATKSYVSGETEGQVSSLSRELEGSSGVKRE